jgi:hypothetical protein
MRIGKIGSSAHRFIGPSDHRFIGSSEELLKDLGLFSFRATIDSQMKPERPKRQATRWLDELMNQSPDDSMAR